jgi:dTMP kinase
MFVVIDGPDGAGKSSLCMEVVRRLVAAGRRAFYMREPGSTEAGEFIREVFKHSSNLLPATRLLLIGASRAELTAHIKKLWEEEPDLIIVMDRWVHSTLGYQGYYDDLGFDAVTAVLNLTDCLSIPIDLLVRITTSLVKEADCNVELAYSDRELLHSSMQKAFQFSLGAKQTLDIHTSETSTTAFNSDLVVDLIEDIISGNTDEDPK